MKYFYRQEGAGTGRGTGQRQAGYGEVTLGDGGDLSGR